MLNLNLSYSRFWKRRSLVVKAGELTSAFGSFLLRYDDAVNPLVDQPQAYGYYYNPVTTKGLAGAEVDATVDKVDLRAQFTNSSPANARGILDNGQFGTWTAGGGYTILQGLRVGASFYRGPYLNAGDPFLRAYEADPKTLPATGIGLDVKWGRGPWNVYGEWQHFQMDYAKYPTVEVHTGYAEVRRVLHPRWFVAARLGYYRANLYPAPNSYEIGIGFRPNRRQLVKLEYEIEQSPVIRGTLGNTLAVQVVTSLHMFSIAGR